MQGWHTYYPPAERINHNTATTENIEGVPYPEFQISFMAATNLTHPMLGRQYASPASHILLLASLVAPGARCLVRSSRLRTEARLCNSEATAFRQSPDRIPYHLHILLRTSFSAAMTPPSLPGPYAVPVGRTDRGQRCPGIRSLKNQSRWFFVIL